MKKYDLIKQTFIGSHLTKSEIEDALLNGDLLISYFSNKELLHLEGDACINLEVVLTGRIINTQIDSFGNELLIKRFEPFEIIAGNIIFGESPKYPLSFFAQSDGTMLLVKKKYLFSLFIEKPCILKEFLSLISDRALTLVQKVKLGKRRPLRELIMEYLNYLGTTQNSDIITMPITKKELADHFAVQRTSVSREFSRMEQDGVITFLNSRNKILIIK